MHGLNTFDSLRRAAPSIANLRAFAWSLMREHTGFCHPYSDATALAGVGRIVILASSSRGGTSVTAELFQWQGAHCSSPSNRVLTLPGEEKPHLILAGFAFPGRRELFDDLSEADADAQSVAALLRDMASEVGYPILHSTDLELYAHQLYRRLLLQWPLELTSIDPQSAISRLTDSLRGLFGDAYADSEANRRRVLDACVSAFPFIRTSFYDRREAKQIDDADTLASGPWSFEETPFVLPPPWHNATPDELATGTFLLRDPSNAWRMRFWRAVFDEQPISLLHLIRDAQESLQGLCDGWNYPFGFQTLPSEAPLEIPGYTNVLGDGGQTWKRHRLNFSTDRRLSQLLLTRNTPMQLVDVCAHQWLSAHQQIVADSLELGIARVALPFAALRRHPRRTFIDTCAALGLEPSRSGVAYAEFFSSRWVMATVVLPQGGHERWRTSPYSTQISAAANRPEFIALARDLDRTACGSATAQSGRLPDSMLSLLCAAV